MQIRDIAYYGLTDMMNTLYNKSKSGEKINHIMELVSSRQNILLAIKNISTNPGRNTKGLDGVSFKDFLKQDRNLIIKEIRQKLYHKRPGTSRRVYILKSNGKRRPLEIANIIDRITQQCFLNILIPITEAKFSENSFGFRMNCTTKHAFAKIANIYWKSSRPNYVIDIDFKSYFDKIPVERCLDNLRDYFNIVDPIFFKNIKRVLSADTLDEKDLIRYNGIGLPQGGVLSPTLSNVYLHTLDIKLDSCIEYTRYMTKDMWVRIEKNEKRWDAKRNGIPYLRYTRYADDIRIITSTETQVHEIIDIISEWSEEWEVELNTEKTKYYCVSDNDYIEMVGYKVRKGEGGIIISPSSVMNVKETLKSQFKLYRKTNNPSMFIACFITLCSQYDICTNLNWLIKDLETKLNNPKRGGFKAKMTLEHKKNGDRFYYITAPNKDGCIMLEPWKVRNQTNISISKYLKKPFVTNFDNVTERVDCTDYISQMMNQQHNGKCIMYLPGLLHIQKFKCYVTGKILRPGQFDIHHKIPTYKGGKDKFNNLVLIGKSVHYMLHSNRKSKLDYNPKYIRLKNLL